MKKLMMAAAVAAMGVSAFANCTPTPITTSCAEVYNIKLNVKTTKGLAGTGAAGQCVPGACAVIRVADSTVLEGYFYDCACGCNLLKDGLNTIMWDSKRKAPMCGAAFTFNFMNVMGKKQADAETEWTFAGAAAYDATRTSTYTLTGAGYGKYDVKNARFKSFSGNFAGNVDTSFDLKTSTNVAGACACDPSQIWDCTDLTALTDASSVAFGTWTIKYNASASKKLAATQEITDAVKIPAYVVTACGPF